MVWSHASGRKEMWTEIGADELPEWFGPMKARGMQRLDERTRLFEDENRGFGGMDSKQDSP